MKALEDYLRGSADLVNSIRKTVTARLSLWFNPTVTAYVSALSGPSEVAPESDVAWNIHTWERTQ